MASFLGLLALAGGAALFFYPPVWQAGLRSLAAEAAARRGLRLEVGGSEGGPLEGIVFHRVRLSGRGTDLRARRVELHFVPPAVPYFQRPKGSLLQRLVVEGLEGEAVLTPPAGGEEAPSPRGDRWPGKLGDWFAGQTAALASRLAPAEWSLRNQPSEGFALVAPAAGGSVRAQGLRLTTGEPGGPGFFSVGELDARGPGGLAHRSTALHGAVGWRGTWLTLRGVELFPGVTLDGLTVEFVQLVRRGRLEGEATVRALGGEIRAQGTAGPGADGRPNLAVACTLTNVAVLPVAELLGVPTPVLLGGTVRAGQFSFRGDPARPRGGTGSLLAEMLDFRYGSRAWQRLRVAASFLPPRATIHELKLVQGANTLDLEGEFPMAALTDPVSGWRSGPVQGRLDAHLVDLQAFGALLGPTFPAMTGRLDLHGDLRTVAGSAEDLPVGNLRVSGGPFSLRNTPVDRLRAELHLRHGELEVEGFHASRADDALTGKGTFRVAGGAFRYVAEGRAHLKDLSVYAGALPPGLFPAAPRGTFTGEWSGDGGPGSHAGAFKGRAGGFLVPGNGPGALPRAVDVETEGTYSPESVAFRRFLLRDSADPKADFNLRLENVAIPWTQNGEALAGGHFLQPDGTLAGRVESHDLALDLVAPLLSARLGVGPGTDGRLTGWLDLGGSPRVPSLAGAAQLRRARLRWRAPTRRWAEMDGLNADLFLEGRDHLRIEHGTGERPVVVGGGSVTFGGQIAWTDRTAPLGLDLNLQGKNVSLLDSRTARVRGDADLTLRGPHHAPEISGDVRVREGGRFWRQPAFTSTPPPLPPATVLAFPTFTTGPFKDAAWGLHLTAAGPLLLEGPGGFRGELHPDLHLAGTGRRPVLQGEFTLRRAKLTLPAAELDLDEGRLRLGAPDSPDDDLLLDLPARQVLPAARKGGPVTRLRADFSGPAREGHVDFSADPPQWLPAEVAAFLVDGVVPPPAAAPPSPDPAAEPSALPKLYLRLR